MRRGEIYRVELDPTVGSEQRKERRCVVIRRNVPTDAEAKNPMTVVVPLADAKGRLGNVLNVFIAAGVAGTTKDSRIVCQQIRAIDKKRIVGEKVGDVPADIMAQVDTGLRALLDL